MGSCINKNTLISAKSIVSLKKEIRKNIEHNENEDLSNIFFKFSDFSFEDTDESLNVDNQSEILNNGRIENIKLIFK